jgi:membrane associated rhomboid family serine protease
VLFPRTRVLTLFFSSSSLVALPASVVLLAWFALHLFARVGRLGTQASGGVAYWAHVGGFAFGALLYGRCYRPDVG